MKSILLILLSISITLTGYNQQNKHDGTIVKTANGVLEGVDVSGIYTFKGVPYAAPPVDNLRWREPQPAKNWSGIRKADTFGPRAMQRPVFSDMMFRSNGISEDCLYLNIWTPARPGAGKLPVLVYFYGGGFIAGDGSELRYDGENMARRGIVTITVNYRLNIFGFFSHPELTKESPHHASGNYGLLDQAYALKWVQQNIAAFGGDPARITIAGESAGSYSVSAQMASPLSRNVIAGAIGESGSLLSKTSVVPSPEAEQTGLNFADSVGATSLAQLRAMPADQLLAATARAGLGRFPVTVDGYFFPKSPTTIYNAGEQAKIPLLAGWNSQEGSYQDILGEDIPTKENFTKAVRKLYHNNASADILKVYNPATDEEVAQVATDLASDRFIGYGTWKWIDIQSRTGSKPVYRYLYSRPRPAMRATTLTDAKDSAKIRTGKPVVINGAGHSVEIEYALGNLATNRVYDWQPADYRVSVVMQSYFANFIKTGNPNGIGVPVWPAVVPNAPANVMNIDASTKAIKEKNRERYQSIAP